MQYLLPVLSVVGLVAAQTSSSTTSVCGSQIYTTGEFTCFTTPSGAKYPCAITNGNALQLCGESTCYDASKYACVNNALVINSSGTASMVATSTIAATTAGTSGTLSSVTPVSASAGVVSNGIALASGSVHASGSSARASGGSGASASQGSGHTSSSSSSSSSATATSASSAGNLLKVSWAFVAPAALSAAGLLAGVLIV